MNESHFVFKEFTVQDMVLVRLYSLSLPVPSLHSPQLSIAVQKVETDIVTKVKVSRNLWLARIESQDSNLR